MSQSQSSSSGFGFNLGLDFGSLIGAGVGLLSANASAKQAYRYQSKLQRQAYNLTQLGYREGPKNQRIGLESAGYNPMLAVQNGIAGANSTYSSGQAVAPDYTGGLSAGLSNVLNIQNMKNQTEQARATIDEAYANADKAKAEKSSIVQKLPFISQREKAEISNIEKDSLKKEAEIHNIDETTRFIEKDFELRKRLGLMGIDVQRYGINQSYNASTYATNTQAETQRGMRTDKLPFGFGSTYYDMRGFDKRMRTHNSNDRKYWREYYN